MRKVNYKINPAWYKYCPEMLGNPSFWFRVAKEIKNLKVRTPSQKVIEEKIKKLYSLHKQGYTQRTAAASDGKGISGAAHNYNHNKG